MPAIRALGSALYDNPGTLLNGHLRQLTQQQLQQHRLNINNLKSTHLSSHEHSDSGLSAESHEYSPYNSERLVLLLDWTLYTNKSCKEFTGLNIIIIIIISFMHGIYTYIPETNYVPREHSVAVILLLLFMVHRSLAPVLNLLYFYISLHIGKIL